MNTTDRAARAYLTDRAVAAMVGVLLLLGFLAVLVVSAAERVTTVDHQISNTPPAVTCWDYGDPWPQGWTADQGSLPSCHH